MKRQKILGDAGVRQTHDSFVANSLDRSVFTQCLVFDREVGFYFMYTHTV